MEGVIMDRLKRYKLEELLDECDLTSPLGANDEQWLDMTPVGLEVDCPDAAHPDAGLSEAHPGARPAPL